MKGKAKIQLINNETGEIEYEKIEENQVTLACQNLFNQTQPIDLFCNKEYVSDPLKGYTPLYKNVFGGIMLFSNAIQEDINNIMPTKTDIESFIGCASNQFSGKSKYRGTYNVNESKQLDETTFRYVYDFPTNAANGLISTIALSSGNPYLDVDIEDTTDNLSAFSLYGDSLSSNANSYFYNRENNFFRYLPPINYSDYGDYLTNIDSQTSIFIKYGTKTFSLDTNNDGVFEETIIEGYYIYTIKIKNNVNLFTNFGKTNLGLLDIEEKTFISTNKTYSLQSPYQLQFKDNKVILTENSYDVSLKQLTLKIYEIDFSEAIITNDYSLLNYKLISSVVLSNVVFETKTVRCIGIDGRIYITAPSNKNMYVYNIELGTFNNYVMPEADLRPISFFDSVLFMPYDGHSGNYNSYYMKNDGSFGIFKINNKTSSWISRIRAIFSNDTVFKYPVILINDVDSTSNSRVNNLNFYVFNPCFLTINTIEPIVKSPTQTLKIIYELTGN